MVRTKKTSQLDERPSGEVKRMETLMTEALDKIKPTDPLRLPTKQSTGNETDQTPQDFF